MRGGRKTGAGKKTVLREDRDYPRKRGAVAMRRAAAVVTTGAR